jgi:hypothetical protein
MGEIVQDMSLFLQDVNDGNSLDGIHFWGF